MSSAELLSVSVVVIANLQKKIKGVNYMYISAFILFQQVLLVL